MAEERSEPDRLTPPGYVPPALPDTFQITPRKVVVRGGFEPPTHGFSVRKKFILETINNYNNNNINSLIYMLHK
ncbi:hypothetical protein [Thalassospira sp.]|uniref:hypothetical protein n=1 Tax=Thalassospira sp. TaxID=1912094 RepID=UPI002604976D|nr:hypothetical protein [Thalassospira sp.]